MLVSAKPPGVRVRVRRSRESSGWRKKERRKEGREEGRKDGGKDRLDRQQHLLSWAVGSRCGSEI
jgi:hypothetical protein